MHILLHLVKHPHTRYMAKVKFNYYYHMVAKLTFIHSIIFAICDTIKVRHDNFMRAQTLTKTKR